jgi:hypothetical protein
MSSAAKGELGALYINAWEAIPMQLLLKEIVHKQLPTPIQTNSSTANGVVTNNIQPQRTKGMDMRFHWLCCQEPKANSDTTGAQDLTTKPTTGQNIIVLLITLKSAPLF